MTIALLYIFIDIKRLLSKPVKYTCGAVPILGEAGGQNHAMILIKMLCMCMK